MDRARPYLIAAGMLALAVVVRVGLEPLLGLSQVWLTFWPAAFLSAWWGNARAGIAASLGSIVIVLAWIAPLEQATLVSAGVFASCTLGFVVVAEKARRSRRAEVAANRAKDQFLAMLGHELRNPLAPISTAVELMRMRGQQSREIDIIERQVTHMTRLVDDLLDISRIVRGEIELRKAPVDIRAAIDKAVEMSRPLLERTGNPLDIEVQPGFVVNADVHRLTQVFSNLLANAIKFSKHGVPITVRGARDDNHVRITVIDRGCGIRPELLERLFTPFVQEEQRIDRKAGGLGLGLAIARKLVELHGGTIGAASEGEGHGAKITIELPLVPELPAGDPQGTHTHTARSQRILLVDDNHDIGATLSGLLESWGHTVAVAYDGPQALKLAETFMPTLALLDIGLPVMDGHELARQLRAKGFLIPMIAITGYGQDTDRAESKRAGFSAHLVKPVDVAELGELLTTLAGASAAA